ncbi:MAG: 50S ribosomal protein L11 methyltransferase [Chlamydiota bacterium]
MSINWEEQWALFAPNFHEGHAHIELQNGRTLKLKPGPGFGDLSHPTTRLCLSLLEKHVTKKTCLLDIGCGSGILSLASSLLGAKATHGIDIDEGALIHARLNKQTNHLSTVHFSKTLPQNFLPNLIIMNMIESEQRCAWNYKFQDALVITSGILNTQRSHYLQLTTSWGWTLLSEQSEASWLSFVFAS